MSNFSCFCCLLSKLTFSKKNQEHYQSVLILVQTVCKRYQQETKVAASRELLLDFSLTVKVAPHECVIRTCQTALGIGKSRRGFIQK